MRIISLSLSLLILLPIMGLAAQDEAYGVVTNVVDGDTFDVTIEKADSRIVSGIERVRLADVNSPEIDTAQGPSAKDFTFAVLMNKRVYLDIDDLSGSGRDTYGRLICVVYLTGYYGQPLASPNFNRMLVDSGHASLDNFTNNEFNPKDWWSGRESGSTSVPLESLLQDPLRQLQQSAGNELEKEAGGAWDWIKGQISIQMASRQKA
jgi:micrococcal nuclease